MTQASRAGSALFVFRRDLRLADNTAFIAAARSKKTIIAIFILDPRQVNDHPYRSTHAFAFMIESLIELSAELQKKGGTLHVLEGKAEDVIAELLKSTSIDAVYLNRDYTPFALKRDATIAKVCERQSVPLHILSDALLHEPEDVHKADGTPYTIFTPFWKRASALPLRSMQKMPMCTFQSTALLKKKNVQLQSLLPNTRTHITGGRTHALKILKKISSYNNYTQKRDAPSLDATTHLSAHLKFGTVSVREVHTVISATLGANHPLLRQLYWRDFFTHIAHHFPHIFGHAFQKKFDGISWNASKHDLKQWCEGRTGFPIVDAGMRELNETGYMHNRVRMITASFLIKDLHIDWRIGERFFATQLVDYDPSVNNGNWQWAASTGCDAVPYFRIFNPWTQQKKFDPTCTYIKKWIPELRSLTPKQIHQWEKKQITNIAYPVPMCDHVREAHTAKVIYQSAHE